jgi:Ca2+-binding EF-hand superfamily protein
MDPQPHKGKDERRAPNVLCLKEAPIFDAKAEHQLKILFNFFGADSIGLVHKDKILALLPHLRDETSQGRPEEVASQRIQRHRSHQITFDQFLDILETVGRKTKEANEARRETADKKRRELSAALGPLAGWLYGAGADLSADEEGSVSTLHDEVREELQFETQEEVQAQFKREMGLSHAVVKVVKRLFRAIDVDGDGSLHADEVLRINKFIAINEYYTTMK